MEIGKVHWDGKNNYEEDQMEANNSIAIETQGLARDLFVLHLDVVGEQIKEVEAADPEEGKNLGEMSDEEVIDYFETDVTSELDRKSTRLNSSHVAISYAVFCLKKKKKVYVLEI